MITDILIYENGNGGECVIRGNDAVTVSGYENSPYLAMFGGTDWHSNDLLQNSTLRVPGSATPAIFSSQTETVIRATPLTSAGREKILNAAKNDLAYLNNIAGTKYDVTATVTAPNRLELLITIDGAAFLLKWNPDTLFLTYTVA